MACDPISLFLLALVGVGVGGVAASSSSSSEDEDVDISGGCEGGLCGKTSSRGGGTYKCSVCSLADDWGNYMT